MELSIREAATALGKSERQVRYLIRQGSLTAEKVGHRWRIDSGDLPIDERRRGVLRQRLAEVREELDSALEPMAKALDSGTDGRTDGGGESEGYSVRRLKAFEVGSEIYREVVAAGVEEPVRALLFEALAELTKGCHAFHAEEKAAGFRQARSLAAVVTVHLLLDAAHLPLADRVEQELIPKLAGLIASQEKGHRRTNRFDRFGATKRRTP